MDSREELKTKPQDRVDQGKENHQDLPADKEDPAQAITDEVETAEDFDPETADKDALLQKYREIEDQLAAAQERELRIAADADNFKKRIQREKEDQVRYANEAMIRDLLPVIDNLERALDHSQGASDQDGLTEGLNMTLKGFLDSLARFGCTPVEAMGSVFDPNFHEAVSQEEASDCEANTVIRELQKGYMLKERLIRPAMVVVSKPASQGVKATSQQEDLDNEGTEAGKVRIRVKKA